MVDVSKDGDIYVTDLASIAGTTVLSSKSGVVRLEPGNRYHVRHLTVIAFGSVTGTFVLDAGKPADAQEAGYPLLPSPGYGMPPTGGYLPFMSMTPMAAWDGQPARRPEQKRVGLPDNATQRLATAPARQSRHPGRHNQKDHGTRGGMTWMRASNMSPESLMAQYGLQEDEDESPKQGAARPKTMADSRSSTMTPKRHLPSRLSNSAISVLTEDGSTLTWQTAQSLQATVLLQGPARVVARRLRLCTRQCVLPPRSSWFGRQRTARGPDCTMA